MINPQNPALPNTVITMGNTLGSSLAGNGRDKAEFVSGLLNMRVCTYERPGSGGDRRWLSYNGDTFFGRVTPEAAESLGVTLRGEGAQQLIVASHSADGPFGMGLVLSERLPVVAFAASDPVGIQDVTTWQGFKRWYAYRRLQSQPGHPSPETPPEWKAPPESSISQTVRDMALNHRVWREARVAHGLSTIARLLPRIAVQVVFPEHTFNGDADFMRAKAEELHALGEKRPAGAQPFVVGYEPGRAHGIYDDPRYFGGLVVDALASLDHQPEQFVHPMYQEPTFRHAGAMA